MQGSWNEIISFPVFVLSEYGFQTYYTAEDYAIYYNLYISSLVLLFTKPSLPRDLVNDNF